MALARRAVGIRRGLHRLSLRARLLLGLLLVALAGLVVADVVVYQELRSYLNQQLDQELHTVSLFRPPIRDGTIDLSQYPNIPAGTFVELVDLNGAVVATSISGVRLSIPPHVLGALLRQLSASGTLGGVAPFNARATGTSGGYRVLPEPVEIFAGPLSEPAVAFVGLPLSAVAKDLHQLVFVDLSVTAALLAALILVGYGVVRVGLRPLEDIEATAGAIAAGDLTRRIEDDDLRTEVGRLGASLNTMLAQIQHAFEEQQLSEQRLRQFLADASHELRTPVTSIRGYAELFRRGAASRPDDLATSMRRIEEESVRMGALVDDLLLLARLDQGRALERELVDVAAIVTDAAADAQALAPGRAIDVDATGAIWVLGDEHRLRQVVANLAQNALRHTPEGTAITFRAFERDGRAVVEVADEGPGIAPEHLPHLFERFYRADPSRTRGSGGSGLGLAIVASIVEAHGGTVHVSSTPGAGSTFSVELPLSPDPSPPAALLGAGTSSKEQTAHS